MSKIAWAVLIGVVLLIVLSIGASLLVPFGMGRGIGWGMMGRGMMGGFGFPFFFMGGIGRLLFWVLIIGGVVWLVQGLARGAGTGGTAISTAENPLDILKRRYAKGEISKEQFEEMKRDLGA